MFRENLIRVLRQLLRTLVVGAALSVTVPCIAAQAAQYQILASEFPPFVVATGSDAPGALGEMVNELGARVGVSAPIQFLPWPRAQALAQRDPHTLLLPLTRSPEREAHYRWLVKLYPQRYVFIARRGTGVNVQSIDTLRTLRIVTLRDAPEFTHLTSRNFTHVFAANSVDDMARMLQLNIVDAIYSSRAINLYVLGQKGLAPTDLSISEPLVFADVWLGGSLDFTQDDADTWQKAMKQLKADGGYDRILRKYHLIEAHDGQQANK